jgi:hypothetical protein
MSSGKSLTFYSLFNEVDFVEIPILQRDYAQGRSEEGEVRSLFLRSLFNALTQDDSSTRQSLDLDFVYGNYEDSKNKVFSVLDGQQRLTTLFLLHWYLAVSNDRLADFREQFVSDIGQSRFTYKTRTSTTEFFNALVASDFVIDDTAISKQINDCQWFYLSWKQDPTVQACLCMLNAIQNMFAAKADGLFERLSDTDKPFITFQFLDLDSFGLSDELYIKMNARGKPLTVFENFKAKLEQFIESYDEPWPEYRLSFREDAVNGYEYFIHKIDTDWADLFWPYRNISSDDNTFDDEFMNFFRLIIMYQYLLDNRESPTSLAKIKNEIFGTAGRLQAPSLSKYEELNCFNQRLIIRFIDVIDRISGKGLENNKIQSYLDGSYYYSEGGAFERIIANSANYDDKLRFFAFYSCLEKSQDPDELKNWMRVIYNLVENTITDSTSDFYRALFVINDLCQIDSPILEALEADCKVAVFTPAQVLEEKIKAHLILKSDEWSEIILDAEKHAFFNGQIGCILNFSGILEFYREHGHCDWNSAFDKTCIEQFQRYFHSLASVFNTISKNSSSIDYAWERAVLSKGVYCTTASWDRYNLLSSRDARNNIPRDHSWRRLLRIGSENIEQKQSYVKAVLDDQLFDAEKLGESLEAICANVLSGGELEDWQCLLIKHKALINYCMQGFISHSLSETILLSQSQRNHYHSELFTKALELELKASKELLAPFTMVDYEPMKSRDGDAYAQIKGCVLDGKRYFITIVKPAESFIIRFRGAAHINYSEELQSILDEHGFKYLEREGLQSDFMQRLEGNVLSIQRVILELCSDLRGLTDE